MIRYIKSRLTMSMYQPYLFFNKDNQKWVHIFIDCYGVKYMAARKWGYRQKMLKQ